MKSISGWPRNNRQRGRATLLLGLLIACAQGNAHHGTRVSYDWSKPIPMTGTVTEFVWRNPHARLFFDATDEQGNVVSWGVEMSSPTNLTRAGWTRTTLEPGDDISLTLYPSRAGTQVGELSRTEPVVVNGVRLAMSGEAPVADEPPPLPEGEHDPRDLTGVWLSSGGPRRSVTGEEPAPMTAAGQAKYDSQLPSYGPRAIPPALGNDPAWQCNPEGVTRMLLSIRPFELVQAESKVVQLFERGRTWREIWTDGRALPENPDPRWLGYSVGEWQGDTLVVETIGLDDRTWLDSYANPHSDSMRLVERYRRTAYQTLELDMEIHDPQMYTAPVVVERKTYTLTPQRELGEAFCAPADEFSFNERIRDPAGGVVE